MTRFATKPIVAILMAICICTAGCGTAKTDKDQVQGTWMTVAGSDNGKAFPPSDERQGKVVVAGDQFAMYEDATSPPQTWSFHLDPTKSPKQIDFDLGDKQAPGIYELDGDHWKVAMIMPGKPRPTDFKGADFTLVLEMKRGEPAAGASPPADKATELSADKAGGNESAHRPASEKIPADKSSDKAATDDSPPGAIAKQKPSPREMAYGLGYDLSLAAYSYAQSMPQAKIDEFLNKAKMEAKELGTQIPPFPEPEKDQSKAMAVMTHYVLVDALNPISAELKTNWGDKDATLFELACKTSALHVVYDPSPDGPSMAGLYREDGPKAGLPESVWRPMAEFLDAHKPAADIVDAIGTFHAAAFKALAEESASGAKSTAKP